MKNQIKRIVLSEYGDYLIVPDIPEHCKGREGMFKVSVDTQAMGPPTHGAWKIIGHSCGGHLTFSNLSQTHNVLACDKCNARVVFPKEIQNFYALNSWLKGQLQIKKLA